MRSLAGFSPQGRQESDTTEHDITTRMAVIFPSPSHRLKVEIPGAFLIQNSLPLSDAYTTEQKIKWNEAIISNLSLTLEDIEEFAAKANKNPQTVWLKLFLMIGQPLIICQLSTEVTICAVINSQFVSAEVETKLHKVTKQATWFKKVTPSADFFSHLLDLSCFGSQGPCLESALQSLGILHVFSQKLYMHACSC